MKKNNLIAFVIILALSHFKTFAAFTVKMVLPFDVIMQDEQVALSNKITYLEQMQKGQNIPLFKGSGNRAEPAVSLKAVVNDLQFFSLDIADNSKGNSQYVVSTNIPASWSLEVRRQALLSDWYSSYHGVAGITYWGDAMPQLKQEGNNWTIPVKKGETVRLNFGFKVLNALNMPVQVVIQNRATGERILKNIPLTVYNKKMPAVDFSSIVFNSDNTVSYPLLINTCTRYGFTHMQVNYIPEYLYDANGNIVGTLNLNSTQTLGFMQTAIPWVQQGLPVLFFWQPHFATKNGFIQSGEAWQRAYVNTVQQAVNMLKQQYPSFRNDQVILYVYDEIGSSSYATAPSQPVKDARSCLAYLKKNLPQFKRLVTFGYNSFPADIDMIKPETDILVPHFIMPEKLEATYAPASYSPAANFKQQFTSKTTRQAYWAYMVEPGKSADIRDFRMLPMLAALNGYSGFSWYAFCNSSGWSWVGHDGDMMDYGLYYRQEVGVPLYDYWTKGINQSEAVIPSIRSMAAGAGIQDAKILRYLTENKARLSAQAAATLKSITSLLQSVNDTRLNQPDRAHYLNMTQIETISRQLREVYGGM